MDKPLTEQDFMRTKLIVTLSGLPNSERDFNEAILWTNKEKVQSAKRGFKTEINGFKEFSKEQRAEVLVIMNYWFQIDEEKDG
jgi:hypothetical protein